MQNHLNIRQQKSLRAVAAIIMLFLPCAGLRAQDVCKTALEEAEEAFDKKLFAQSVDILKTCLPEGIAGKEQRIRAYEVLALSHYNLGQEALARETLRVLLTLNQEYTAGPAMEEGFKALVEIVRKEIQAPAAKTDKRAPKWTWWANGAAAVASGIVIYYVFKENAPVPIADPPKPPARP